MRNFRALAVIFFVAFHSTYVYSQTVLTVSEELQNLNSLASQAQNEGSYDISEKYRRQLVYRMEELNFELKDLAYQYNNLGSVLNLNNKPHEAKIYLDSAAEIFADSSPEETLWLASLNGNYGITFLLLEQYEISRTYFEKAIDISSIENMLEDTAYATSHLGLGKIEFISGNYELALLHYDIAIPIFLLYVEPTQPVVSKAINEYEEIRQLIE